MLIWKNFKMEWTIHASTETSVPCWTIHPARFIALHPRMTVLTPGMVQTLGRHKEVTAKDIMDTINDQIGTRWKQRGTSPGLAGDQPTDPPGQNWTELEQLGTPQQNNFVNTKETSLALRYYYSPKLIKCGEELENCFFSAVPHHKCEELVVSSRPRNKGSSGPAPLRMWKELRTMG